MSAFIKSRPLVALVTAAGLLAFAAPSLAAPEGQKLTAKTVQRNGQTLYCVKNENVTGSRVAGTTCLTKEDWKKDGAVFGEAKSAANAGALAANAQPTNQN